MELHFRDMGRNALAMWDHAVLPATGHKWTRPARQSGTQLEFTYPGGLEGSVDLGGWFHTESAAVLRKRIKWPWKRISKYYENAWNKVYKNAWKKSTKTHWQSLRKRIDLKIEDKQILC